MNFISSGRSVLRWLPVSFGMGDLTLYDFAVKVTATFFLSFSGPRTQHSLIVWLLGRFFFFLRVRSYFIVVFGVAYEYSSAQIIAIVVGRSSLNCETKWGSYDDAF